MGKPRPLQTTLGEWIAALSDAALETMANPAEARRIVAFIVDDFLSARGAVAKTRAARRASAA